MQGFFVFKLECGIVIKFFMFFLQVYWFGLIVGVLLVIGIYYLVNNFFVITVDDFVIIGQEFNDIVDLDKKEDIG